MKVVCGLGNPGPEYAATRHNVGWWALDEARRRWRFPAFARSGRARVSDGVVDGRAVRLVRPASYMNRSGGALAALLPMDFAVSSDLMVVVDDAALDVGRIRMRAGGSAGGHNGLRSIEDVLRTRDYARLRIGVGTKPDGVDLADWVLAEMADDDARAVRDLLPAVVDALEIWIEDGVEQAANRTNR